MEVQEAGREDWEAVREGCGQEGRAERLGRKIGRQERRIWSQKGRWLGDRKGG
jgi:hypothetical protein